MSDRPPAATHGHLRGHRPPLLSRTLVFVLGAHFLALGCGGDDGATLDASLDGGALDGGSGADGGADGAVTDGSLEDGSVDAALDAETSPDAQVEPEPVISTASYGPDPDQCPPTVADHGASVVHACDCQGGADPSCVPGIDTNDGTASAPLRSLSAAIAAFNGGSDIALCRGGAWTTDAGVNLYPSSCTSEAPCVIQDYGDAELPAPLLQQTGAEVGLFEFDPHDDVTRWEGVRIQNLHLEKTSGHNLGSGIFVFRDVNDVVVRCVEIEGFGIGMSLNPSGHPTSDVAIHDSYIHDNGVMGWLGGTDQAVIERNRFDNNGYFDASPFTHNVYVSDISEGMVVRGNWLTRSAVDASGRCVGVSLNVHSGVTTDLLIENNLVEEPNPSGGCWGLMVDGVGAGDSHTHATIRGNVLRDVGNLSIGVASCIGCTIENNVVVQTKIGGSVGIASPNRPTGPPDADVTGTIVRNNTVYFGEAGSGIAYYVGERGTGYVVTNNIGFHADPVPANGDSCFNFDLPASEYATVDGNLCFGAPFDQGTTGMDAAALVADPMFVDAPMDLSLRASSPARDSGTGASAAATDLFGNARDDSPDRGAYEFIP